MQELSAVVGQCLLRREEPTGIQSAPVVGFAEGRPTVEITFPHEGRIQTQAEYCPPRTGASSSFRRTEARQSAACCTSKLVAGKRRVSLSIGGHA